MKKFISVLLDIILVLSGMATILFFSLSSIVSKKNINHIVEEVSLKDTMELLSDPSTPSLLDQIYQEAESIQVSKEQIDQILESEQVKEIAKDVLNNIMEYQFDPNQTNLYQEEELKEKMNLLLQEVNQNHQLNLSEEQTKEITESTVNGVSAITESIKKEDNAEDQEVQQILQFLVGNGIKVTSLIILITSAILLLILNWKNKRFFHHYFVDAIIIAIWSILYGLFFQALLHIIIEETTSAKLWNALIDPVTHFAYLWAGISFAIAIVCGILKKVLIHPNEEKELTSTLS